MTFKLNKVIKIIRSSKNPEEAKNSLLKTTWKINQASKLLFDSKTHEAGKILLTDLIFLELKYFPIKNVATKRT